MPQLALIVTAASEEAGAGGGDGSVRAWWVLGGAESESDTLAGPHGRTAASHGALCSSASRLECVAQPGAWRVHPKWLKAASCGVTKEAALSASWQATAGDADDSVRAE